LTWPVALQRGSIFDQFYMGRPVCGTRHIVYYPTVYNAETLLDIHARAHESMRRLIVFCGNLTDSELRRPLTGFGFHTVLRQLEHTIGAEVYWQTVLTRGYTEEATMPSLPDVAAIEPFRAITASATRLYLQHASEAELNSARHMISDPGQTRLLRPADVIMRVVTHIFNHQGQVLAMCRTMGKPNDKHNLDYPLD
jgi:uncharacterized damage-inducible protein DinB